MFALVSVTFATQGPRLIISTAVQTDCMIVKVTLKNMEVAEEAAAAAVVAAAAAAVAALVSALTLTLPPVVLPLREVYALVPGTFSVVPHQLPRLVRPVLIMAAVEAVPLVPAAVPVMTVKIA